MMMMMMRVIIIIGNGSFPNLNRAPQSEMEPGAPTKETFPQNFTSFSLNQRLEVLALTNSHYE